MALNLQICIRFALWQLFFSLAAQQFLEVDKGRLKDEGVEEGGGVRQAEEGHVQAGVHRQRPVHTHLEIFG